MPHDAVVPLSAVRTLALHTQDLTQPLSPLQAICMDCRHIMLPLRAWVAFAQKLLRVM